MGDFDCCAPRQGGPTDYAATGHDPKQMLGPQSCVHCDLFVGHEGDHYRVGDTHD